MKQKEAFEKLVVNIMTGKLGDENKELLSTVEQALTELEELKRYPTSDEVVVISLNHEDVRKSIGKNDVKSVAIQNDYITIQQAKDKVHEELVRDVKRYFEFGLYVKASDKKEYDELIERLKKVGTKE